MLSGGFRFAQPTLQTAPDKTGKRSAERRIVQPMSAPQTGLRSLHDLSAFRGGALHMRRARLSALTLAALATGCHPDGSAPEPGFPLRRLAGVLPASPKDAAVKHAPCGPVLVPVDRGPEAARVRIGKNPPAGTASRSAVTACRPERRPCERDGAVIVIAAAESKGFSLCR